MGYTRGDYTVAWICALPLEMTAAKLMLDKVHPSLPQPKTDHNAYTLGSIGGHNVVVACLPSGVYGTTSAAIVLAHMLPTFPSLRFALMVGIGGGVPSKTADIRLGDVVVSMPTAASGGVIQYDYGKTLRDGNFQRTGSLNKPPQYLLTAVSQIRSDPKTPLKKAVTEMLQKHESIRDQFSPPSKDWLFEAAYDHEGKKSDCSECDRTHLVDHQLRESGESLIHYGLIASGNQVMKNAQIRDSIAQQTGILCFEMEAAGLMDQLPCLVIRGICDYCDSHKHKEWQGYAALTAAAYAAHLLYAVPVTENITPRVQTAEFTEEEKACLRSLFITDPTEDKNSLKRRKGDRAFGTCSWIFETDELQHWLGLSTYSCQEERSILWLYGNPGTGKSTMAITLSEELLYKPYFQDGSKTIAYFFCDSGSDVNRTAISVLRGLLYQLIKQRPTLMRYLLLRYIERKDKLFGSFDALWAVLLDIAKSSDGMEFYYIIDALDECEPDSQEILLGQINQTFGNPNSKSSAPSNMHFLITSRPYHEIRRSLSAFRSKDLAAYEAVASDLRKVIQEKVEVLSKRNRYPKALIADISRVLEDKAEGTFLWVGIACDELAQVQSRNALKTLEALPCGLNSLYQKLLDTAIITSGEGDEPMILEMLSFVAFALRPLTLAELSEACQLYPDEEEDCRLQFTQEIIDLCRLMIVVQGRHVRLLHKSVKDFLLRGTANIDDLEAHATLAHRCINNILQTFQLESAKLLPDDRNGFLSYSTVYWPQHASLSKTKFTVIREHERFFLPNSGSWKEWMRHYNSLQAYFPDRLDVGFSTLHAAARWGIPLLSQPVINGIDAGFEHSEPTGGEILYVDSDFATIYGVTPLVEAARSGQIVILRILLERGPSNQRITQDVMKAAAGNTMHGNEVMAFLLDQYKDQTQITDDVIEVVAQNQPYGKQIMILLLEQCKDRIQFNPHLVSTIIGNFDVMVVTFLLDQCEERFQITEGMIEAAAQNYSYGNGIISLMLSRYKDQVWDSPRLVSTIIQNFDVEVVKFVLRQWGGNRIQLTDDIFKAAARNYRHENIIFLLIDQYSKEIVITKETVWPGIPIISKVEYTRGGSTPEYNTWRRYAALTGAYAVKDFLRYWRSINREAGERYWNVPSRGKQTVVTRNDEIAKIEGLIVQHTVPARIMVCGPGGVGKTQIALEVAYRIRKHDHDYSIFWISCSSVERIEQSYLSIAHMLGFSDVEKAKAESSVRHYLCQKQAGKCLLVFDGADDFPNLTEYLPQNQQVRILITARDDNLAPKLASTDVTVIDLSNLSIEVGLKMLQNSLADKSLLDDQETAIILVQKYGLSLMAITHLAGYINRKKINLSQCLTLMVEERMYNDVQNLGHTLEIKIQQIQQQNQLAADYLSFMVCMNPDNIPQSLLPPARSEKRAEAIGLLKDSAIIQEMIGGYLTMHRSMRMVIRDWMESTQQFRQQVFKAADRLSEVFPSNDHANKEMWREYLPHAMSLLAEAEFQAERANYTSLIQRVGRCLFSDERYSEATTLFEIVMNIHKNQDSDTSSSTLFSMADLAWTYEKQDKFDDAKELELHIMELSKRVLATEYPDSLEMIRQSSVLQHQGKHEETVVRHEQAPEGRKKGFEPENLDNLEYFSRLGFALDRQRKHEEAEILHRIAFGGLYKVLGPKNRYTLTGIFNLAYTLVARDKKEDALTHLKEFIELRSKSLGSDQLEIEDVSYCRSQWEDYYRMRLFRKQQQEQKMANANKGSQRMGDRTPAQRFIQDHPSSDPELASLMRSLMNWKRSIDPYGQV